jgi:DNA (cytosine-5)-methyltransferase 1
MFDGELVIDNFAGGGGASTGIAWAIGRDPDAAINHDAEAIAVHKANHPATRHYTTNIWRVDPRVVVADCGGLPVGLAWFSPDCKHFSKAKGGKPVEKRIRDLAWVVVHWAKLVRPRIVMLENVEEFKDWGPLIATADGKMVPCPVQKGITFKRWVRELRRLGYAVEWRELRAFHFGTPTIRKRLFVIARRDGRPIVWPEPTHDDPKTDFVKRGLRKPWRTAAECIDFTLGTPSIFERERPLAPATMARIARGVWRYVINNAQPFIVPVTHHGDARVHSINEPLRTITTAQRGEYTLVAPTLVHVGNGERAGQKPRALDIERPLNTVVSKQKHALVAPVLVGAGGPIYGGKPKPLDRPFNTLVAENHTALIAPTLVANTTGNPGGRADSPLKTVTTGNHHALVSAFLAQHNAGFYDGPGRALDKPVSTILQSGSHQSLVTSHLVKLRGTCKDGQPVDRPMPTVTAGGWHVGEVRALLLKYYGTDQDPRLDEPMHTLTTKARMALVTVHGSDWQIVDIGMRMLNEDELFAAMGFPPGYVKRPVIGGKKLTKTAAIRMCGNSVPPDLPNALVRANEGARASVGAAD